MPVEPDQGPEEIEDIVEVEAGKAGVGALTLILLQAVDLLGDDLGGEDTGAGQEAQQDRPIAEPAFPQPEAHADEEQGSHRGVAVEVVEMAPGARGAAEPRQLAVGAVEEGGEQPYEAAGDLPVALARCEGGAGQQPGQQPERGQMVGRDGTADQRPDQGSGHEVRPARAGDPCIHARPKAIRR